MSHPQDTAVEVTIEQTKAIVHVWFKNHALQTFAADQSAAQSYAAAIGRRFPGLRVTIESGPAGDLRPLPCQQLWTVLTP